MKAVHESWLTHGAHRFPHVHFECRTGDGLSVLQPGDASVISVLGVGLFTLKRIMDSSLRLEELGVKYAVVQSPSPIPQNLFVLRRFFHIHDIRIVKETLLEEAGVMYSSFMLQVPSIVDVRRTQDLERVAKISLEEDFGIDDLYLGRQVCGPVETLLAFYRLSIERIRFTLNQRTLAVTGETVKDEVNLRKLLQLLENRVQNLNLSTSKGVKSFL
eukprot:TRINITY_DN8784_c0_g2_i1.p1 TRINITY_DN8784_c0_g2~~TRINITY_DN8784_c0_g2_i1.p1  ORF type:complete len:224 (-),score=49.20 TRINITY_DN8784_c0_g2_i1:122-769(-)